MFALLFVEELPRY